ncbi:MAG: hypothetical protein HYX33_03290 [Actinobacteria bacterium]|nr:hypothetical protein [Actinomycetota bacterium]
MSHRNALRFSAALRGRTVVHVDVGSRLEGQGIPERLVGDGIERVDAADRHHLFRFASGRVLHSSRSTAAPCPIPSSRAAGYRRWMPLGPDLLDARVDPAATVVVALARCDGRRQEGEAINAS